MDVSKVKAAADSVRQKADLARKTIDGVAPYAKWVPVVGQYVGLAQGLLDGLDDAIDALDDAIDKLPA